jgi:lysozyme family protein
MANFIKAYEKMIRNEGGYVNHKVAGDRGGQTFAGIARRFHPNWEGWHLIDMNESNREESNREDIIPMVMSFYREKFWDRLKADQIHNQLIAESLFDFSVNTGLTTAIKLAQIVVNANPDGIIGSNTLEKLNATQEQLFITKYALAKVARYTNIVKRDRSQKKFLLGWLNRTLRAVS